MTDSFQNGAAIPQFVICPSVSVGFARALWWVGWHTRPNPGARGYAILPGEGVLNVG